jgi:hypothetical protein
MISAQHAYKDLSFAVDLAAEASSKVTIPQTAFKVLINVFLLVTNHISTAGADVKCLQTSVC